MWPSKLMVYSVLVVVLMNIKICQASGRLSIQLMDYNNKKSTLKDGGCCDNTLACIDDCDNYFKICITDDSQNKCNLGKIETKVLGNDKLKFPGIGGDLGGGIKNPLVFQFQKWKVVTVSIEVWDYDILSGDDSVDTIQLDIQDNPDPDSQSATTNRKRLASSTSPSDRYLDINVKVYCDRNFLVPDCSRQCVSRDDDQGHYTCDYVNGQVACNKFWYGDRCTKYCQPRNDTLGNYTCDISGEKNCSANWFGGNCSRYCQPRNDMFGQYTCDILGEKNCSENWFGKNCSKYCRDRDDENGHYKCEKNTGRKTCLSKWYGVHCSTFCSARDNTEGHYYCNSTSGEKICLENWFGANCTKHCIDESKLSLAHFKCDVNGNRICFPGWKGEKCNKTIAATIISSLKTFSTLHTNQHRSNTIHTRAVTSSSKINFIKTPSLNSGMVSSIWNTYNQLYTYSSSDSLSVYRDLRINSTSLSFTARIFPTKSYTSRLTSFHLQATPATSFNKRLAQATSSSSITSPSSVFVSKNHESRKGRASRIKETTAVYIDGSAKILTSIATVAPRQEEEAISFWSAIAVVSSSSNIQMASCKQSRLFNVLSSSTSIQLEFQHSWKHIVSSSTTIEPKVVKHSLSSKIVSSSTTIEPKVVKHSLSSKIVSSFTTIESKVANTKLPLSSKIVSSFTTIESKVDNKKHSLSSKIVSSFSFTTIEPKVVKHSISSKIVSSFTAIEPKVANTKLPLLSNIVSSSTTSKYLPSFNVLTTENGTIKHATISSNSSGQTTTHGGFPDVYLSPSQPLLLTAIPLSRLSIKSYNQSSIAHAKPKLSKITTTVLLQTPKPMSDSFSPHRSKALLSTELSSPPSTTKNSRLSTSTGINPVETILRNSTNVLKDKSTDHERFAKRKTVILFSVTSVSIFIIFIILIFFAVCVRKFYKRKMCSRRIHPLSQSRDGQNQIGLKLVPRIPRSRSDQNLLVIVES